MIFDRVETVDEQFWPRFVERDLFVVVALLQTESSPWGGVEEDGKDNVRPVDVFWGFEAKGSA